MTMLTTIILVAGKGRRMQSLQPKVLHCLAGRAMVLHLIEAVKALSPDQTLLVVSTESQQAIADALADAGMDAELIVQSEQLGSGHAVAQTKAHIHASEGDVLILYGDVPFTSAQTMQAMVARLHAPDAPLAVLLAFEAEDASGYGRVLTAPQASTDSTDNTDSTASRTANDYIERLVEDRDATLAEKECRLCNGGPMIIRARDLFALLAQLGKDNAQGEYYLTDIINIAIAQGKPCAYVRADDWLEVAGVNSRAQLAEVEGAWQARRRAQAMAAGATLIAPQTVWFAWDTQIGRDVLIEPNVYFGAGVRLADNVTIRAHSHIVGATIAEGAEVGPFARLREGTQLAEKAKVGNFVEVKKTRLGKESKANHLTYLGDCDIGARVNIGAGAISCNYDGYRKHRTAIGDGAFIGSNAALVAPVQIGAGALVAAGSVVTFDIAADDLYLARGEAKVKAGGAKKFRDKASASTSKSTPKKRG